MIFEPVGPISVPFSQRRTILKPFGVVGRGLGKYKTLIHAQGSSEGEIRAITIGIIASLRHFVPLNTLHHIYISLIQPYLLYGIVAWGQAAKTYKNKILILQKRALRLMFFGDYNSHAVPYFVSSSFLPLDLLYFKSVAILMHDISNSLTPTNISNLFASQSNIHSYNTRSSSRGDYYVKHSRLDKQTKSFSRYGVKIWNSLPCEMRQMSKNNFKINVHDTLLRILSEENDYIDFILLDLITKIS